jgi:DNA-directed RNA polymerase subunit D
MQIGPPSIEEVPFLAPELGREDFLACARRRVRVNRSSSSEMNKLRRSLMTAVPTLAIDSIDVRMNTSSMTDEVLALRLGLTPLRSYAREPREEPLLAQIIDEARGEHGSKFTLRVRPELGMQDGSRGRPVSSMTPVLASHIRHSSTGLCISVFPSAVIHFLLDGHQAIDIEAVVRLGTTEKHHKHVAFSECVFIGIPRVVIAGTEPAEIADVCPAAVFVKSESKLSISQEENCTMCGECVKMSPETINISESERDFLLLLRPTGRVQTEKAIEIALTHI